MTDPTTNDRAGRIPPWGSFVVTGVLLLLAARQMVVQDGQALAGAIVGYVVAYWLPARRAGDK